MNFGKREAIAFLNLAWVGRVRMVAYSRILILAALPTSVWVYLQALGPGGSDFLAFWSAGRLIVSGAADRVYDLQAAYGVQSALGRDLVFAFVNPPPMMLAAAPLGFLSFPVGWLVWVGLTYAFWITLTRRLAPELSWPIAAFPGALIAAWHAQTGLLTGGFQAGFAGLLQRRPWLAGFCAGCLIIKPHLALLIPVALVAGRHWRAFAGAAASVAGLMLVTWLLFGSAAIINYRQSWPVSRYLMDTGDTDFFLRQATVYAALRAAGWPLAAAVCQTAVSLLAAVLTWVAWSGRGSLDGKIALLMAATPLATPYLFNYDLPFLIIPVCWLVRQAVRDPSGQWERPMLLLFYLAPFLARAAALPLGANLSPWISGWMLWIVWKRLKYEALAAEGAAEPLAPSRAILQR